jgi:hypothetical protein
MPRLNRLGLAALVIALGAGISGAVAADDDDDSYDVDFYNHAGDSGTVILDGNVVCSLAMKQNCSQTLQKSSGSHRAVFHATAGYEVSESFDAGTCADKGAVSFDIYDDHVEISCNGLAF